MLGLLSDLEIQPRSLVATAHAEFALVRAGVETRLAVLAEPASLEGFAGNCSEVGGRTLLLGPADHANAACQ